MLTNNVFTMKQLTMINLEEILELQNSILHLDSNCEEWLRVNNKATFEEVLNNDSHYAVGHFINGSLVSVGVLYDAQLTEENIAKFITQDITELTKVINLKLVFSSTVYRGCGLARELVQHLNNHAKSLDKTKIYCTIHPSNIPSQTLFQNLGYKKINTVEVKYGVRDVWCFKF